MYKVHMTLSLSNVIVSLFLLYSMLTTILVDFSMAGKKPSLCIYIAG